VKQLAPMTSRENELGAAHVLVMQKLGSLKGILLEKMLAH